MTDLAEITERTLLDGCVEETVAALTALAQLDVATDEAARSALARIAEDEIRHAELAWKFVAWALSRGDARIEPCIRRLQARLDALGMEAPKEPRPADVRRRHDAGRLTREEQQLVRVRALSQVVRPALGALLASARGSESLSPMLSR